MTAAGAVAYGYDNNGNQTSRGADTFTYNTENRLTATNLAGTAGSYAYNGDGLRTSRTIGATTTTFAWGSATGMPVVLRDSAGNRYLYGRDLISVSDSANKKFYYHTDGLGSTTAITGSTGAVVKTYQYDVFGSIRTQTGTQPNEFTFTDCAGNVLAKRKYYPFGLPAGGPGATPTDKLFTGQQSENDSDDQLGLSYFHARFYSANLGRFMSPDPIGGSIGDPQSWNPYSYVRNNPLRFTDPTGKCIPDYDGPRGCGLMPLPTEDSSGASRLSPAEQQFWDDAQCAPCFELERLADTGWPSWLFEIAVRPGTDPSAFLRDVLGNARECSFCDAILYNGLATLATLGVGGVGGVAEDVAERGLVAILADETGSLTIRGSSRALGQNLERAGFQRFSGEHAHHIVAAQKAIAEPARRTLARFGVELDSAENGVFLPGKFHQSLPDSYYRDVNRVLGEATNREQVVERLRTIGDELLTGSEP
jgi:RHS repeat-associated protein